MYKPNHNKPKEQRRRTVNVPCEALSMGVNDACLANLKQGGEGMALREYRGGFPTGIRAVISDLVAGRILNLYSGRSILGDVRVDLECDEATHKMPVEEFISTDNSHFDWVIIDPPYKIRNPGYLKNFKDARSLSGNTAIRDRIRLYLRQAADNVLFVDYCSPTIRGFTREKIWLFLPGNCWESCRVMTWLKRTMKEMPLFASAGPDPISAPGSAVKAEHPRRRGSPRVNLSGRIPAAAPVPGAPVKTAHSPGLRSSGCEDLHGKGAGFWGTLQRSAPSPALTPPDSRPGASAAGS